MNYPENQSLESSWTFQIPNIFNILKTETKCTLFLYENQPICSRLQQSCLWLGLELFRSWRSQLILNHVSKSIWDAFSRRQIRFLRQNFGCCYQMLISPKATDTIYQAVLHLLERQGFEEKEPLRQHVLLSNAMFLGYRFQGVHLQVDWLAQNDILVVKNPEGKILLQEKLSPQKPSAHDATSCNDRPPIAA